ncbi:hypothetical protein Agub_g2207, partial [Astrephomene gubernaculifera]
MGCGTSRSTVTTGPTNTAVDPHPKCHAVGTEAASAPEHGDQASCPPLGCRSSGSPLTGGPGEATGPLEAGRSQAIDSTLNALSFPPPPRPPPPHPPHPPAPELQPPAPLTPSLEPSPLPQLSLGGVTSAAPQPPQVLSGILQQQQQQQQARTDNGIGSVAAAVVHHDEKPGGSSPKAPAGVEAPAVQAGGGGAALPPSPGGGQLLPPAASMPSTTPLRDSDPLAVVRMGISLRGLRKLRSQVREFLGPERYALASTADVNSQWVQAVTAALQCRLVELPGLVEPEDLGVPMYFVSHAWKNSFDLLIRGVEEFLESASEDTRVWVDIAAVNQHPTPFQQADVAAFKAVVRASSGGTLVVLDLTRCNPATRAWCVYEWAATLGAHGPDGLHMAISAADRATLVSSLDVEAAECFVAADKEAILADVVAQHGSTAAFNDMLKLQLLLQPLSYRVDLERLLGGEGGAGRAG